MAKPKLTAKERGALSSVRNMLDSGLIEYRRDIDSFNSYSLSNFFKNKKLFNMACPARESQCGTVACIGGWMGALMGLTPEGAQNFVTKYEDRGKFSPLFYPPENLDYQTIKPAHAVKAIDNFITNGNPRWDEIVKRNR